MIRSTISINKGGMRGTSWFPGRRPVLDRVTPMNEPKRISNRSVAGLVVACVNALLASMAMWNAESLSSSVDIMFYCSVVLVGILIAIKIDNILFLARTLFIFVIGYYPLFIKTIDRNALFSGFEPRTQDFEITVTMYVIASLALLGNEIGLYLGGRKLLGSEIQQPMHEAPRWKMAFFFFLPILALVAYLAAISRGPSILSLPYAYQERKVFLGNIHAIGVISLLAMTVAIVKTRIPLGRPILIGSAFLFLGWALFLRGSRQDVMSAILGMYVCYCIAKVRRPAVTIRVGLLILLIVVVAELWGVIRVTLCDYGLDVRQATQYWMTKVSDRHVHTWGTVSPICTTFANTIHLVETGQLDYMYGKSYWEFILRTPPAFIYPNRPRDYAWMFGDYGLQAGGGIYPLAEAYMNFGVFGALFVPAVISYLISRCYYGALLKQNMLSYFLFFSFAAMFLRGTWYQTFAFYKTGLTSLILLFSFWFVNSILARVSRKSIGHPIRKPLL